jgi:hypothetical protein
MLSSSAPAKILATFDFSCHCENTWARQPRPYKIYSSEAGGDPLKLDFAKLNKPLPYELFLRGWEPRLRVTSFEDFSNFRFSVFLFPFSSFLFLSVISDLSFVIFLLNH